MSLDGLPPAHLQVLLDGLPVFEQYGLLLAGGYAFRAHEILHRPSQDLDFATSDNTPLPEIAAHVQHAFQRAGYSVRLAEAASPRYARLVLQLPGSGEELEMDLLKEALEPRWVTVQITPAASVRAVSLEDTAGVGRAGGGPAGKPQCLRGRRHARRVTRRSCRGYPGAVQRWIGTGRTDEGNRCYRRRRGLMPVRLSGKDIVRHSARAAGNWNGSLAATM